MYRVASRAHICLTLPAFIIPRFSVGLAKEVTAWTYSREWEWVNRIEREIEMNVCTCADSATQLMALMHASRFQKVQELPVQKVQEPAKGTAALWDSEIIAVHQRVPHW